MSENNSEGLRAILTEVSIMLKGNSIIKIEPSKHNTDVVVGIKTSEMYDFKWIYMNHQESISLIQAINKIAKSQFVSEYAALRGENNEQACEIKNLKTLLKAADENAASMQNTIKEYSDRLELIQKCADKAAEEFKSLERIVKSQQANIANTEEAFIRQSAILHAKENRIKEYKKQLEQAHKHIELIGKGKQSANKKKWKKKYKENLRQKLEENNEKFYSEIKSITNEYESNIEGKGVEIRKLNKEVSDLKIENKWLKHNEYITINGNQIKSKSLVFVALEMGKQFANGRTIEMNVLNNKGGQLIRAALYCISPHVNEFPEGFDSEFRSNIDRSEEFLRIIYAAALLIMHLDMEHYIKSKNELFENLKKTTI